MGQSIVFLVFLLWGALTKHTWGPLCSVLGRSSCKLDGSRCYLYMSTSTCVVVAASAIKDELCMNIILRGT